MNLLSWDNLSRILSGGVGVGSRFKALKRPPSPKSSRQWSGQVLPKGEDFFALKPQNALTVRIWILGINGLPGFFLNTNCVIAKKERM